MFGQKKVGIIGTGWIAEMMAKTLRGMKGVTCYAVASRTLEKAEKFAKEYRVKKAYGSYQELCMDPKVDLVYVATPHSEHFENVCLAIEYGKNVLCEKAFAMNEKQADRMFKLAAEKDVLLTEAMWTRFLPLGKKLKEIISSNKIGDVSMVTADLSFNIAWKQRIQDKSMGGGALLDLGVYGLTFASMVLGDDVSDISAMAIMNDAGVDMQTSITLKYRSGQMAVITCSALSCGSCKGMVFGTNGHIEVDTINNYQSIAVYDNTGTKDGFYKKEKQITGYEYEVAAVIDALSQNWKECPEMPKSETMKIMNMLDFIRGQIGLKFDEDDLDFTNYAKAIDDTVILEDDDKTKGTDTSSEKVEEAVAVEESEENEDNTNEVATEAGTTSDQAAEEVSAKSESEADSTVESETNELADTTSEGEDAKSADDVNNIENSDE